MSLLHIFKKNKNIDFLAIGDVVIDAFIKLQTAEVHDDATGKKICLPFGEKIPFESATEIFGVGNSANAAVSASRLGLSATLLTHMGDDAYAIKNKEALAANGVGTGTISLDQGKHTNYHYVLWYQNERTILIKHEEYQYKIPKEIASGAIKPRYVYLSSLGENTLDFHKDLASYLNANPDIKLVFQPGTYQIKFGTEVLSDIYKRTDIFFCNKEEAVRILQVDPSTDIKDLLAGIKNLGVKLPVITDGPNGSYTYDEENRAIHIDIYPDMAPPLERTGAGDGFASTFAAAKSLGLDNKTALMWGSINSMSVCQYVGAQEGLLKKTDIEKYLSGKPSGWNITFL